MNELPKSARRLIDLERAASGPSRETRERVRMGVALALAASAGTQASPAQAAAKHGPWLTATGKLWLVAGTIAVFGGVNMALRTVPRSSVPPTAALDIARTPATPALNQPPQPLAQAPLEAAPAEAAAPRLAALPQQVAKPSNTHSIEHGDLRAETLLLASASSALERGDLSAAHAQLTQYRVRFAHGQLRAEHQGLELLAHCMANEPGAPARAQRYLKGVQSSVLADRIEATCKPKPQP